MTLKNQYGNMFGSHWKDILHVESLISWNCNPEAAILTVKGEDNNGREINFINLCLEERDDIQIRLQFPIEKLTIDLLKDRKITLRDCLFAVGIDPKNPCFLISKYLLPADEIIFKHCCSLEYLISRWGLPDTESFLP